MFKTNIKNNSKQLFQETIQIYFITNKTSCNNAINNNNTLYSKILINHNFTFLLIMLYLH